MNDAVVWDIKSDVSEEHIVVVPSSLILSNLMMEAIRSSESWVSTRATRLQIPQYVIPQAVETWGV
jgi:hypothetical protein